ncbi:MAG: hypothetical protein ACLQVD_22480 [Capsulimonadaceae bacterium]
MTIDDPGLAGLASTTLRSLLRAVLDGIEPDTDWFDLPRDYPVFDSAHYAFAELDWLVAQSLRSIFPGEQDDDARTQFAFSIMASSPPVHNASPRRRHRPFRPWDGRPARPWEHPDGPLVPSPTSHPQNTASS